MPNLWRKVLVILKRSRKQKRSFHAEYWLTTEERIPRLYRFSSPVASTPLLLSLFDATVPILGWHRLTYRIILKLKFALVFG